MMKVSSMTHHRNGLPRTLDELGLCALISELLDMGGRVAFRAHAYQRMEERDITAAQVMQVLRRGQLVSGPTWDNSYTNWKFTMRANTAGEEVSVGAAIDAEPLLGQVIFVITVFA